jgi:hypothetical protein
MPKVFAVLVLIVLSYSPSRAQQALVDANDPRILFDSKNHDVGKIPGVITRITDMEKTIESQLTDITRNINDLANLQSQLLGL